MSPLLDALERARLDFDFTAVADLWRNGYQPTDEELEALAAFTTDAKRRATQQRVANKARAALRFKELRDQKWTPADAREKIAAEFGLHPVTVETVTRGRNAAVNRLLAEWAGRTAYQKS